MGRKTLKISNKILSRVTWATILSCSVLIGVKPVYGDTAPSTDALTSDFSQAESAKAASDIAKLEEKFFAHSYAKDTWQSRLDRVEKMVFGEPKTGSSKERLAALLAAVPNLASSSETSEQNKSATKTAQSSSEASKPARTRHAKSPAASETEPIAEADSGASGESSPGAYPAVTAIEKKIFGKDYSTEPVNQRLSRLETNVFGKTSSSNDLSDRVDRLKQKTGIDIARQMPSGSDWADDDQTGTSSFGMPAKRSYAPSSQPYSSAEDDFGFDTAQGGSGYSGGSMGMAPSSNRHRVASAEPAVDNLGLDQQVAALEREIFGKTYTRDPLAARLNRLEASVFPQKKPSVDLPLPDRVKNLLAVIPISQKNLPGRRRSDDDTDLSEVNPGTTQSSHGGLSKIISSLSNMMGGNNMTGGYPVRGNYVTDPRTGYLIDPVTGSEIDPNTGTVVGHVAPTYGSGLGSSSSFGSFGNGFSPFGSPYGSPYGMGGNMGGMGTGMRFGFGGGRFGGF